MRTGFWLDGVLRSGEGGCADLPAHFVSASSSESRIVSKKSQDTVLHH